MTRVKQALTEGSEIESQLADMVFNETDPKIREERERVGQVFTSLGYELNLGAIDLMANSTLLAENRTAERLSRAGEGLEDTLREERRKTKAALDEAYRRTTAEIDAVERDAELSYAEQQLKIREIKARAAREMKGMLRNAHATVQHQMHTRYGIGQKNEEIETLLVRAHQLASGIAGSSITSQHVEERRDLVEQKLQGLYDRYVTGIPSSFVERGAAPAARVASAVFAQAEEHVKSASARSAAEAASWQQDLAAWL